MTWPENVVSRQNNMVIRWGNGGTHVIYALAEYQSRQNEAGKLWENDEKGEANTAGAQRDGGHCMDVLDRGGGGAPVHYRCGS